MLLVLKERPDVPLPILEALAKERFGILPQEVEDALWTLRKEGLSLRHPGKRMTLYCLTRSGVRACTAAAERLGVEIDREDIHGAD